MKNLNNKEISYFKQLSSQRNFGKHFICVSLPKTGSTFLTNVVADLLDWDKIYYNNADENIRSYSFRLFLEACEKNGVVHLHSDPSPIMIGSAIHVASGVTILKRDFIEYCHSLLAHICRGQPTLLQKKIKSLNRYDALNFIAIQEFGWFYRFIVSWEAYSERIIKENGEKYIKIIDHADLFSNTELVLSHCLNHSEINADILQIKESIYNIKKDYIKSNYYHTNFDYNEAAEYSFFKDIKRLAPKLFTRSSKN